MSEYITETININDVINENKILKDKLDTIMKENKQLKRNIQNLQDLMGCVICEYFNFKEEYNE
jgi:cell division protein FtsB